MQGWTVVLLGIAHFPSYVRMLLIATTLQDKQEVKSTILYYL